MALQSMTALASITLQEASTSVTFSGIPQNYRDLVLVIYGTVSGLDNIGLRFNGDNGSNYLMVRMGGNGSTTYSSTATNTYISQLALDTTQGNSIAQIIDYSATDKHKTVLVRQSLASFQALASAERWANTAAINTVLCFPVSQTFAAGSTFNLYGRIA